MTTASYHIQREPLLCGDGLTLEDTRFETVRLARRCNGLASDLEAALARRDHWFREREKELDNIEVLQKEILALIEQRDACAQHSVAMEVERNQWAGKHDALAAQVEAAQRIVDEDRVDHSVYGADGPFDSPGWKSKMGRDLHQALADAPTTHLKAQWQAEGALAIRHLTQGDDWEDQELRDVIDDYVTGLRRQAEEG